MDMIWNYFLSWWRGSSSEQPLTVQVESVTHRILTVTVLRAKTQKKHFWSKSDFYVTLLLPTATATTQRTKTINNTNNPEWNETFSFRVPSQTKNVLEVNVFDEDLNSDDWVYRFFVDLETLELDSKLSQVFKLNPEAEEDILEMEFELRDSEGQSLEYVTNGIVMGAPLSILSVKVQKLEGFFNFFHRLWGTRTPDPQSPCRKLKVSGAYKECKVLDPDQDQLHFHINQDLETKLELTEEEETLKAIPLKPHHSTNTPLTLEKELGLKLESRKRSKENLGVRLDLDIPPQEKEFLKKRKPVVAKALQTLLGLDSPLSDEQVPVIALVGSGGGSRASTGFLGSLKGLKEIGVLDTVTYMSGVSGSTWAMSTLCQDKHWSQNLENIVSKNKEHMTKNILSAFSLEKMNYYHEKIKKKVEQGHLWSYIDVEGLILEHLVFGQENTSTLSDQQKTVKNGQNPFPIYTAVNSKEFKELQAEFEWVEFTPFEVGLQKYGVFVKPEDFGSEFFLGHVMKKLQVISLPYLMGIWSSAISVNLKELWSSLASTKEMENKDEDNNPPNSKLNPEPNLESNLDMNLESNSESNLDFINLNPESKFRSMFDGFFLNRPINNQTYNFTRGLSLHQDYSCCSNFLSWNESHPDAFPNWLTPSDSTLRLIDSGHIINIGCPPVLRPQRRVDIIIVLSDSWETENVFDVLKRTSEFCEDHKVPFPKSDYTQDPEQALREVYVFEDHETPTAPIVLFLPLVNASFKKYKAPGVPRETPEELAEGQVDVTSAHCPYRTMKMSYSTKDYDALINLTRYNVLTSRDTILSVIQGWINGHKQD